jgi:hypothetical protein
MEKPGFSVVENGRTFHGDTEEEANEKSLAFRKKQHAESQAQDEHHLIIMQGVIKALAPVLEGLGNGLISLTEKSYADRALERAHELALVQACPEYATKKLELQAKLDSDLVLKAMKIVDDAATTLLTALQSSLRK